MSDSSPKTNLERAALLDAVFAAMHEGVVVQDENARIIEFNQAALNLLGLTEDQLLGRTSMDPKWRAIKSDGSSFPGSEHPAMLTLATNQPVYNVEMGVERPIGDRVWIKINSVPIEFEIDPVTQKTKTTRLICTFSDITEQKRLRDEKEKLNERLMFAKQSVHFGVWDWNYKLNSVVWDEFMFSLFDVEKRDFSEDFESASAPLLPDDLAKFNEEFQAAAQSKAKVFKTEFRIKTKAGAVRPIACSANCFYDQDGLIERVVGNCWDLTEQKALEAKVLEQQAQIVATAKMSSLGEMAGGVAHEINNPLAIISGKVGFLKSLAAKGPVEPSKLKSELDKIESTTMRIAKVIRGLKLFSRNSERDPMISVPIANVVRDTLELCRSRFNNQQVEISIEVDEDLHIDCRDTQISQVLMNLLSNAYDAVHRLEVKWVMIEAGQHDGRARLTVTDSGTGIPSPVALKMMEPFFTTKDVGEGTGLGLSISKGIIEDHRGSLWYDAKAPNTRFVVELPLSQAILPNKRNLNGL